MDREYLNIHFFKIWAVLVMTFFAFPSCVKIKRELLFTTGIVSEITTNSAKATGSIIDLGEYGIIDHGHLWYSVNSNDMGKTSLGHRPNTGSFISTIQNLQPGEEYKITSYVINSKNEMIINPGEVTFTTYGVMDIDGNGYKIVAIGTQVWMAENLKTNKYSNGESISHVTDNSIWADLTSGAYCYYNNNPVNYSKTFGALYNFYAVIDARNVCPSGWHVPSDAEWSTLENYMIANGYNYDGTTTGNKIGKSLASTSLWWPSTYEGAVGNTDFPNYRNSSGFNGFPGGARSEDGSFSVMGGMGYWWTSYEDFTINSIAQRLDFNWGELILGGHKKTHGFSVRCIKD